MLATIGWLLHQSIAIIQSNFAVRPGCSVFLGCNMRGFREKSKEQLLKESRKAIRNFLKEKRQFLLNLLENPNLLEHESFTNLLWAVFHLTDELTHRRNLNGLPETDYQHLAGDMKRAYHLLIVEWLNYMKHLKTDYPYLFSLAVRTNPFDVSASVEVR